MQNNVDTPSHPPLGFSWDSSPYGFTRRCSKTLQELKQNKKNRSKLISRPLNSSQLYNGKHQSDSEFGLERPRIQTNISPKKQDASEFGWGHPKIQTNTSREKQDASEFGLGHPKIQTNRSRKNRRLPNSVWDIPKSKQTYHEKSRRVQNRIWTPRNPTKPITEKKTGPVRHRFWMPTIQK